MNTKTKPKLKTPSDPETLHAYSRQVRYRWALPDGTICHGRTVVLARTPEGLPNAIRRFWRQNTPVEAA